MGAHPNEADPWGQVDDIDGTALYKTLGLDPRATSQDIKRAYRAAARRLHPDKGGDPRRFAAAQRAYDTLRDPAARAAYDAWAPRLAFRPRRGAPPGVPAGGEARLLDEFEGLGLACDAATQLVVTCEVCRRPAGKECWTCGMPLCEFCTLKRHWRGAFGLHWPLINSAHMAERLARRELEAKRVDDARLADAENPHHRSDRELADVRAFKEAAAEAAAAPEAARRGAYEPRLARFWMWAQTPATVWVAARLPAGYADRGAAVECGGGALLVQSEGSPPLIDRWLAGGVAPGARIDAVRAADNRLLLLGLPKAEPGERWRRLFRGDPDGARCLQPPYALTETDDDVTLEVELPFWVEPADVRLRVDAAGLALDVRGQLALRRTFWRDAEEEARRPDSYAVVDCGKVVWSLDDDADAAGERVRVLMATLPKPPLSEDEVLWRRGVRQDNRAAARPGSLALKGWRFFADDEDEYGLEDVLAAAVFAEAGAAYVPAKPWARGARARVARAEGELPAEARAVLARLRQVQAEAAAAAEQ